MAKYNHRTTHIRVKNNKEVMVERIEGDIFVVKNLKGGVIGSYNRKQRASFNKRYKSIRAVTLEG